MPPSLKALGAAALGAERFTVEYTRYRKADALCCPSRLSTVTFRLRPAPGRAHTPLVTPAGIVARRTTQ